MTARIRLRTLAIVFGVVALSAVVCTGGPERFAQAQERASEMRASPTPAVIPFRHPVIFTMALGNPLTNAGVAAMLAQRLHENGIQDQGPVRSDAWIVAQGQWTLGDYLEQCKRDPVNTLGAVIAMPPVVFTSTDNFIVLLRNHTQAGLSLLVAGCHEITGAPQPVPGASPLPVGTGQAAVAWASYTEQGRYGRSQIEFFPLAVLTSVYLALAPQRTYQTTTTTVYPASSPAPTGTKSSVQVQQASVLNPTGSATVQGSVLGAFAGNGLGSTIGGQASLESHAIHAADDAIVHILREQLKAVCSAQPRRQASAASPAAPPSVPPSASADFVPLPDAARPPHPEFCLW